MTINANNKYTAWSFRRVNMADNAMFLFTNPSVNTNILYSLADISLMIKTPAEKFCSHIPIEILKLAYYSVYEHDDTQIKKAG